MKKSVPASASGPLCATAFSVGFVVWPKPGSAPFRSGRGAARLRLAFLAAGWAAAGLGIPFPVQAADATNAELGGNKKPDPGPTSDSAGSATIQKLDAFLVSDKVIPAFVDHIGDLPRAINDVQPYYIFDARVLSESGAGNLEDFMKQRLSMNTQARTGSQEYNAAFPTSSINLRGLGTTQTLILINGRRAPSANISGTSLQADINGIPLSMIERVEVLPSSASAIYGGAAVGGVVDIILKKNYIGGMVQATYTNTFKKDTPIRNVMGTYGFALEGGKTHVTLSAQYSDTAPLQIRDRTIVEDRIHRIQDNNPVQFFSPTTRPFSGATPNIALYPTPLVNIATGTTYTNANNTSLVLKNGVSLNSASTYIPAGTSPTSTNLAEGLLANAGKYNRNLADGISIYGLRAQIGNVPTTRAYIARISREMTKEIEIYTDFSFNRSVGDFTFTQFGNNNLLVPGDSPANPFQNNVRIQVMSPQDTHEKTDIENKVATVGAAFKLPYKWRALLDYNWSATDMFYDQVTVDGPLATRLDSVDVDLGNGRLNPFVDTIHFPPNLQQYMVYTTVARGVTLNDVSLRTSGPLPVLPTVIGATNLTVGLEHRKEGLKNGNTRFNNFATPANAYYSILFGQAMTTDSLYAEMESDLIAPKHNFPLIHSLTLQAASRTEKYTVTTGTTSYFDYLFPPSTSAIITRGYSGGALTPIKVVKKFTPTEPTVGLKYQPNTEMALRISYATAFLPPTFAQLLPNASTGTQTTTVTDPTTGTTYAVPLLSGGNPGVEPQTSQAWNAGFIYQPTRGFLRDFRFNLEYYRITEDKVIGTYPSTQYIVNNVPSRITRDPTTRLLTQVDNTSVNLNYLKTSGIDVSVNYSRNTDIGNFSAFGQGTFIATFKQRIALGGPLLEYRNYVASGGPLKTKLNGGVSWEHRRLRAAWTSNYINSYQESGAPGDPVYNGVATATPITTYTRSLGSNTVASQIYHNVFVSYRFGARGKDSLGRRWVDRTELYVGVNNLFNSAPPFDPFYSNIFYSPFGSMRLREYTLRIKKEF